MKSYTFLYLLLYAEKIIEGIQSMIKSAQYGGQSRDLSKLTTR